MFRGTRGGVGWGVAEGAGGIEINRTPGLVFENRSARFMQTMFLYEQKKKKKNTNCSVQNFCVLHQCALRSVPNTTRNVF